MRSYPPIAVALSILACSEPRLDLHLVRSADSPLKSEIVKPTPCDHCVTRSWVAHDETAIALQVERDPYLSISRDRLSKAEIVHGKWLYRPYCDSFTLSFRLAISLPEMTEAIEKFGGLPTVAIVNGRPVDAGRHIFQGETLTLAFAEKEQAVATAALLGTSPTFREEDDSWRAEVRKQQLAILDELFSNPGELRRLAEEHELQPGGLSQENLALQLFCP